jgi:hypothetical protein
MQAPHWRTPVCTGSAQVRHRWVGWANAPTQASQTGCDGHAWQTAHWLGMRSDIP